MPLSKTSVQLDTGVLKVLQARYSLSPSEIIRLSLEYVLERQPEFSRASFEDNGNQHKLVEVPQGDRHA